MEERAPEIFSQRLYMRLHRVFDSMEKLPQKDLIIICKPNPTTMNTTPPHSRPKPSRLINRRLRGSVTGRPPLPNSPCVAYLGESSRFERSEACPDKQWQTVSTVVQCPC